MKKQLFFTTLVALVFSNLGMSQIKFGVKGGFNLADVEQGVRFTGESTTQNVTVVNGGNGQQTGSQTTTIETFDQTIYVSTSAKISFYAGGFVEFPINKKKNLFLKTELSYCQNGATIDKKEANPDQEIFYTTDGGYYTIGQLNLPLLIKFVTNKKIALIGGCYFGTILLAKSTAANGTSVDEKSKFRTFDFGLELGASYPINKNISLDLRYNRGIVNVSSIHENFGFFQSTGLFYNRTFHLGVEYQF